MLGFNVSDTMKSIRMLLNKHTRNMDLSTPTLLDKEKERKPHYWVDAETVIAIIRRRESGEKYSDIAKDTGASSTTISNIVNRKRCFTTMPQGSDAIRAWFKANRAKAT
jgi:predicted transcriptional regulator